MNSSMVEFLEERVSKLLLHPLAFVPLLLFLFFLYKWSFTSTPSPLKNLPPSPPKLPIIGNLHQIGVHPHRSLKALSQKYGDLMLLHLGSKPALIISSKEMAAQVLKTHDYSFSGKPKFAIAKYIFYNGKDILFGPYGEQLRHLRSICMLQLLSSKRVKSFRGVREEEVALMIEKIRKLSVVNLTDLFFLLANHLICRAAFGRKYEGEGGGVNFDKLIADLARVLGSTNIEDVLPWMAWINRFNGVNTELNELGRRGDDIVEGIVQEHADRVKETREDSEKNETSMKDFVDILLQVQRDDPTNTVSLDREYIKGVIGDMFGAGTHTNYVALEWTFTELMRHSRVMKRLQEEVRGIVGPKEVVVEEDLEKMVYLKAVIKESLRFHPPIPLPIPRECIEDVNLNGYDIAVGTMVIMNVWAIGRDPAHWEEPEEFIPERFLDSPIDFKGQHFEFLPFGGGRRGCPGVSFSIAGLELALANLVYWFDWTLPGGAKCESIDVSETKGSFPHKKVPLVVIATPWVAK